MRPSIFWSSCLAVSLQVVIGCGHDPRPASADYSSAGNNGGYIGGAPEAGAGGFGDGGQGEGGAPAAVAGSGDASGGQDLAGAASGGAKAEAPPFVCDRADIAVPLGTWWVSYCLAKASARSCAADFDECYASTKGLLESGQCTDDDDANKLDDVACAAAALAYACEPPIAADMGCAAGPVQVEFLNEECRGLDAELATRVASCNPK